MLLTFTIIIITIITITIIVVVISIYSKWSINALKDPS